MEIRNLMTFVRIAEIQNFSKTAEQLGYSQSAVTMQIKQLETELHAQLFERIGKQVKLTQAGERLLPHALEILNTVRKAERISQEPEQISGRLRIGTCESLVISMLPPVILEMSQLCPHVEISTHTALVPDLFQMLRQNDIDILYFLDEKHDSPEWIKVSERPEKNLLRRLRRVQSRRTEPDSHRAPAGRAPLPDRKRHQLPLRHGTASCGKRL